MAIFAPVVIADGKATPVNHTFSPVNIDALGIAKWTDRIGGISIGFPTITLSMREPSKSSRNYKVIRKIVFPVLEVTSPSTATGIQPAPTKAYELTNNSEWILPERCTPQDRSDLLAFAKNFDASAVFVDCIKSFETAY